MLIQVFEETRTLVTHRPVGVAALVTPRTWGRRLAALLRQAA